MNPFTFDWGEPLPADEAGKMLERLANMVVARGLSTPVVWMLEIHKPLFGIAGQFSVVLSPMLAPLFAGGPADMQKYTQLMQNRKNVDDLIARIERKSEEQAIAAR